MRDLADCNAVANYREVVVEVVVLTGEIPIAAEEA